MAVKINTMSTPTSPFEILRETGERVHEKNNSFSDELLAQQDEGGVSHEELEAMLKKIDEQAGRLSRTPTYDELKGLMTNSRNIAR